LLDIEGASSSHNQEAIVSIFGNIMSRVLGHAGASGSATTQAPAKQEQGQESAENTGPTGGSSSAGGATAASASSLAEGSKGVDVTAVLDGLAAKNQQKLDWRHSIVDMMKLLGLDSGLSARKELAGELHYSGDTSDSASMNIWLHKEVMQKLAENGGKVPDELRH
jgi:hypothetical protein